MMDRRVFMKATAGLVGALPLIADAQPTGRIYRLGFLQQSAPDPMPGSGSMETIKATLAKLGYVEGRNLLVETRYARGQFERLPALANELVQIRSDVIIAVGPRSIAAAKDATATVPIVMFGGIDPVAAGVVASLARPGGNVTGVLLAPGLSLVGKKMGLLKEMVPRATRIAFLSPDNTGALGQVAEAQKAAALLKVQLIVAQAADDDLARAFDALVAERPAALYVANSPQFKRERFRIIALAAQHRLPAMYEWSSQVEDGGLMSYGSREDWIAERVAGYVDRIFKGAKPADLPVEQPTKIELVINLKTAKALGLTIPQSLLLRADEVIQ